MQFWSNFLNWDTNRNAHIIIFIKICVFVGSGREVFWNVRFALFEDRDSGLQSKIRMRFRIEHMHQGCQLRFPGKYNK